MRSIFFLGLIGGGPFALWTSSLIVFVFVTITAAVLRETCSAIPTVGSLYIWSAAAAGPKYGRFIAFITAWWVTLTAASAWMTFSAAASHAGATYILSILSIYGQDFPGGISDDNVKWRVVIWLVAELLLLVGLLICHLPLRRYPVIFTIAMGIILVDVLLNLTWFPVRVHMTYGFRSAKEALFSTFDGTGATPGWSWMLSFFALISSTAGFEASAHVAEETKNAKVVAARSVLISGFLSSLLQFTATILCLFCTPSIEELAKLTAPQPFVLVYLLALGRGGATFMAILSASSYTLARIRLCAVAASYGLIGLLRLTLTPGGFKSAYYPLGRLAKPFYLLTALFGALMAAVLISPLQFPVTRPNLNYAGIVFGAITIFGVIGWSITPERKWMHSKHISDTFAAVN
ncbi:hypothetical protein CTheo_7487 [Ceratobasidium theobromae]|uniref:Amino acid permease n=1 Tax=Ceratobasidium theobromae TaxID=1582974 RepID=A0A5N5QBF5_9AGAM|nr:hypothetical protein CTheo_7487 [Ceratobasidium theobromae]